MPSNCVAASLDTIFNGMSYTKRQGNHKNVGLSADVVKFLSQPLHFTGVNIITDDWFTSFQLATDLLRKQITLLDMMRKNRRKFLVEFVTGKEINIRLSYFDFNDKQTLL